MAAEFRQRRRLAAGPVCLYGVPQRPVARKQVDILVWRRLVEDVVGEKAGG